MPNIATLLESGPTCSFEFSPPKSAEQALALEQTVDILALTNPDFISITYGAGGSTRTATQEFAIRQGGLRDFPTMPHLTCVGQRREEVEDLVDIYALGGIGNILALRGDGDEPGAFRHAIDLVTHIKDSYPNTSVGVAAHPEVHPASSSREADRQHLAAKLEMADFAITQFFLDPEPYLRLRDELDALGCNKPVIPGVMLFRSVAGLTRMAGMNNAAIPESLAQRLEGQTNPEEVGKIALETTVRLLSDIGPKTLPGVHIYTMNKARPALDLRRVLAGM